jgi:poly(A) polymerase
MDEVYLKAITIIKKLRQEGYEALLAGGCVRDKLLGVIPKDYDIATSATPKEVETLFENTKSVGKAFGVILVNVKGDDFEVATFRTDGNYLDGRRPDSVVFSTIYEDAKRRDLTINSMYYDPIANEVIDMTGGRFDLKDNIIRFVGNAKDRIKEDNLRILRAIRFAVQLDFNLSFDTLLAIANNRHLIESIAKERVREELIKMINAGRPGLMMDLLFSTKVIEVILPELAKIKDCPQNPEYHPEGDVYNHTVLTMENLVGESLELQLAGMFHDIGKPYTLEVEDGKPTNKGHAKVGARLTEDIMRKLKFTNSQIDLVVNLVNDHMKHHSVRKFKKSTLKKFLGLSYIEELIKLGKADSLASNGNLEDFHYIEEKMNEWTPDEIKPKPLISGNELISLGMRPGPMFGKILASVLDLQLEGHLSSKEEAIEFVKRYKE